MIANYVKFGPLSINCSTTDSNSTANDTWRQDDRWLVSRIAAHDFRWNSMASHQSFCVWEYNISITAFKLCISRVMNSGKPALTIYSDEISLLALCLTADFNNDKLQLLYRGGVHCNHSKDWQTRHTFNVIHIQVKRNNTELNSHWFWESSESYN